MKQYEIRDKDGDGIYTTCSTREEAEWWLSKQKDRLDKNSSRYGMHIVEVDRLTLRERCNKAFAIANNAIYLNDKSDYLSALWEVCKISNLRVEEEEIGKRYLEE